PRTRTRRWRRPSRKHLQMRSARPSTFKLPIVSADIPRKNPAWLKVKMPSGENYFELRELVRREKLHTVCESASCPNIGECWNRKSLTIMILGGICTRSCQFCDVPTGRPLPVDPEQ